MTAVGIDITEKKCAERALAQARFDIDQFFGVSLDVMAILDNGKFVRVNPAFERALGLTGEEIVGHSFIEFMHPEDRRATIDHYAARLSGAPVPVRF